MNLFDYDRGHDFQLRPSSDICARKHGGAEFQEAAAEAMVLDSIERNG